MTTIHVAPVLALLVQLTAGYTAEPFIGDWASLEKELVKEVEKSSVDGKLSFEIMRKCRAYKELLDKDDVLVFREMAGQTRYIFVQLGGFYAIKALHPEEVLRVALGVILSAKVTVHRQSVVEISRIWGGGTGRGVG